MKKISKKTKVLKPYYTYILQCEGDVLYTGVTTDYKRRFDEHSRTKGTKKGAKFTGSHRPIRIVALWRSKTRSDAQILESKIKSLTKDYKIRLIDKEIPLVSIFDFNVNKIYRRVNYLH